MKRLLVSFCTALYENVKFIKVPGYQGTRNNYEIDFRFGYITELLTNQIKQ